MCLIIAESLYYSLDLDLPIWAGQCIFQGGPVQVRFVSVRVLKSGSAGSVQPKTVPVQKIQFRFSRFNRFGWFSGSAGSPVQLVQEPVREPVQRSSRFTGSVLESQTGSAGSPVQPCQEIRSVPVLPCRFSGSCQEFASLICFLSGHKYLFLLFLPGRSRCMGWSSGPCDVLLGIVPDHAYAPELISQPSKFGICQVRPEGALEKVAHANVPDKTIFKLSWSHTI